MTFPVLTSHILTVPLATMLPFEDNADVRTTSLDAPSRQSSPICIPLSRSHSWSEPSSEHVIMRRLPGRCTIFRIRAVWSRPVRQGVIAGVLLLGDDVVGPRGLVDGR